MKKIIILSCLFTYISVFSAADDWVDVGKTQSESANAKIAIENTTDKEVVIRLVLNNGHEEHITVPQGTIKFLDTLKNDIGALYYAIPASWSNATEEKVNIYTDGSIVIEIEAGNLVYFATVNKMNIDAVMRKSMPQAIEFFADIHKGTVGDQIRELIKQGSNITEIAKKSPHLILGFPSEVVDVDSNINNIKENYDKVTKSINYKHLVQKNYPLSMSIRTLLLARYYMLAGSQTQKNELIHIGRGLNQLLIKNDWTEFNKMKGKLKLQYGDDLYEEVIVKALVLYYYDIAHKLGHTFTEGTFIVYDESRNIFKFLNSLNNAYHRNASHLNALAETENKNWLAQIGKNHFGFDVDLQKDENKTTLLFNKIDDDGSSLYIKPETHGTASLVDFVWHGISFMHAQGRKQLPAIFGSDDAQEYSKERIPKSVLTDYMNLIDIAQAEEPGLNEEQATALAKHAVARGIQAMYKDAQDILSRYIPDQVQVFINKLNEKASHDPKYSHLDKRFGNEVILTSEEFDAY